MRNFKLAPALMLAATLVLAGCSGEPSESDIKTAVETAVKNNPLAAALMPNGFEKVEKISCKPTERVKSGFECTYRGTVTIMGQTKTDEARGVFVKGDNGWVVTE